MKTQHKNIYGLLLISYFLLLASFSTAQEVVELTLPKSEKIIVKLMFRNGSVCDPQGKDGLTYLTANMITEGGTKDKTSTEIKDFIYPMAANYYSAVDKEVAMFTFEFHKDFTDQFYAILKGLMLTPRFAEDDFKRVKSNQQNYVDQVIKSSSDEEYSKKALEDFLFRGTAYQHMIQGTSEGVKAITLEDVKNQYAKYFTSKNLLIGVAGNYSPEFLKRLQSDMNQLSPAAPQLPAPALARTPDGINVEIISKDEALGSAIFMGFPLDMTRKNDEFAPLMIANSWLGEHRKSYSRLYQKIREQRSMNYGDYSYIEWYNNGGQNMLPQPGFPRTSNYFSVWIRPVQTAKGLLGQYKELEGIKTGHAHFAIRMAIREMDQLVTNGMSKEDFDLTKTFLRSYIKLYIQTPAKQLGFLMDSRFYGRKDYISEMDALLEKTTLQDVNSVMKKYWQTKNIFVTIVTDKSESEELAKSLRENTLSPMSYSNSLKAVLTPEITQEDTEVAKYPLNVKKVDIVNSKDMFLK
ncbi:MAG TPA: insulinase family protein [Bacteroidia bacterium]|nr:insulinase family protein [Bacteroidia bacterium]